MAATTADPNAPTRTRYGIIWFGIALASIQYIDRICISKASKPISENLHLDKDQMAMVFAAFGYAYALFEIPTGWMGDRFGTRKTLLRVVLWWSFFTILTGWAWGFVSMLVIRFLFGMGEAGCFPNLTRAFATWLRPEEKARAQAILWLAARWAGAVTPILVLLVLKAVHWKYQYAFALFGALGIVWAFYFARWFRDTPAEHPGVNPAERALLAGNPAVARHEPVPWKPFLASPTTWLLWAQYFFLSYCWYFYVTWLSVYLDENFPKVDEYQRALLAGVPLFGGGFGNLLARWLMTKLEKSTGSLIKTRRLLGFCGFAFAGLVFFLPARVHNPVLVMAAMGLASLFGDLSMPCSWGACMSVGGKFAGTFSGSMNMMGNLGGALSPLAFNWISKHSDRGWSAAFDVSAVVYLLGAVCWLFVDPVTPIVREDKPALAAAS